MIDVLEAWSDVLIGQQNIPIIAQVVGSQPFSELPPFLELLLYEYTTTSQDTEVSVWRHSPLVYQG